MNQDDNKPKRKWSEKLSAWLSKHPVSEGDLRKSLKKAKEHGVIDDDALNMFEGVLRVSAEQVRDAMIARGQMQVLDADQTISSALPKIIESAHSRFPVIAESRDEVVGILIAKDLLRVVSGDNKTDQPISSLIRPATIIPESKRLDSLLNDFRHKRNHMAIVVDEYGGVSGLITIEDVLEEIVGSINDEYDTENENPQVRIIDPTTFSVDALIPIEEFNSFFATKINSKSSDTIGGIVLQKIGHLPSVGEEINISGFNFNITTADDRRIITITVKTKKPLKHKQKPAKK